MLTARVRAGGSATVVMSRRDHTLEFTTAGLLLLMSASCCQHGLRPGYANRSGGPSVTH